MSQKRKGLSLMKIFMKKKEMKEVSVHYFLHIVCIE